MTLNASAETSEAVPKRRKRWPWVLVGALLFIGIVTAMLPQWMGIPLVRQMIVDRINRRLNGHLEVGSWSLGWTHCEVRDVRLFDVQRSEVFSVARLRTEASLLDLLRGTYQFGSTQIEEPNFTQLVIDSAGNTNLEALFSQPRSTRHAKGPQLQLIGDVQIQRLRGTIVDRRDGTTQIIDPSTLSMKIDTSKNTVDYHLSLNVRNGDGDRAAKLDGTSGLPPEWTRPVGDPLPIGVAVLGGGDGLLRALNRPLNATHTAATVPSGVTTASTSHRHFRAATEPR